MRELTLPDGRSALLAVPTGDDGARRLPLVVAYHGYARTAADLLAQTRLASRAAPAGVLVAFPVGLGTPPAWDFNRSVGPDDVAFTARLLTTLARSWCANPAQVVLTGISDGGLMAVTAACALPGRVRAVMTVAASTPPRVGCRVPLLAVHGTADPLDPYTGGVDARPAYGYTIPAAPAAAAAWAAARGCSTPDRVVLAADPVGVVATDYPACSVALVSVGDGGHTWPGGAPVDPSLGLTSTRFDATGAVLALATGHSPL